MTHSKASGLPVLLTFSLLPIFASPAVGKERECLPPETRIARTQIADDSQSTKSPLPGTLRWIRGTVVSWSSDSLTLKQGKKSLTLDLGLSQQIVHAVKERQAVISVDQLKNETMRRNIKESLAVGSAVQAHYFEQHKKLYAIVIIEETNPIPASQKMSGSSYLGVFEEIELTPGPLGIVFRTINVRIDGRTRNFYSSSLTTVVDRAGHRLAARELREGDTLLITYRLDASGAGLSPITTLLEIRNLTLH